MNISIKRIYETPAKDDGMRVLVDRIWPRGLSKQDARLDKWWKDIAPSHELRKWYGHDPAKWPAFRQKYRQELAENVAEIRRVLDEINDPVQLTLLYGARDKARNQAVVLKEFLEKYLDSGKGVSR